MDRQEQWQNYLESSNWFRPVVVCVKCGSTSMDHKPAGRLTCLKCENAMHWSPDRFRLVRDIRPLPEPEMREFIENTKHDFASAVDGARAMVDQEMRDDQDWYGDTVRAVESFLDCLSGAMAGGGGRERAASLRDDLAVMTDRIKATLDTVL
jgi:hypothetical protein